MEIFNLPASTSVQKVIPKNAFDAYTRSKQKKLFTDLVSRITWTHKLSAETTNLRAIDINEIQIFRIELKVKNDIQPVLDVIDKAIPYHIIFVVEHEEKAYISTSFKHLHPINQNNAVIDWTFKTDWQKAAAMKNKLILKKSLDSTYQDFCIQISGKSVTAGKTMIDLVAHCKEVDALEKEIQKLEASLANCKQFNRKVELNLKLKAAKKLLHSN